MVLRACAFWTVAAALALPASAQQRETLISDPPPPAENVMAEGAAPAEAVDMAQAESTDTAAQPAAAPAGDAGQGGGPALLTEAELQTLVAPVALYPDTLLIQILVGATVPFDVMKADRFLLENADTDPEALKPEIEAEGYDASVEVLATAFPDIVHEMADHIDWTETVGTAMMAQSDDVLAAVQVLRDQAIETGALVDTDQQVVSTDPATEAVIIQPADPEVVYVPQYDPAVVYDNTLSDALIAGAITWGTFTIIDEIFDDDDDWDDYWGCRNCGGWGGGPIIRDPDIDIDIDGDVIIGDGNIGDRLPGDGDLGDRLPGNGGDLGDRLPGDGDLADRLPGDGDVGDRLPGNGGDIGWKPDPDQAQQARDKIADRRGTGGATTLPVQKPESRDDLRAKLSASTGAADISRPGNAGNLPQIGAGAAAAGAGVAAAAGLNANRNPDWKAKRPDAKPVSRPSAPKKPAAKPKASKPAVSRPAASKPKVSRPAPPKAKVAKRASGGHAKAAVKRGGHARAKGGGKMRRR